MLWGCSLLVNETNKKQSVLVVDDEPKVLRFIEIDLRIRGFEVVKTTSGQEALNIVRSSKPDIMLLDIVMPGIDGFQVLKELRTFTDLPVIIFSASPGNYENAVRLGANDFMPKPFNADEMTRRINKLISDHESRQGVKTQSCKPGVQMRMSSLYPTQN
jgi:two-component system KDP operon response regulator KdpE